MKAQLKLLFPFLLLGAACSQDSAPALGPTDSNAISQTWSGAAEVSHYKLKQNRYGEIQCSRSISYENFKLGLIPIVR